MNSLVKSQKASMWLSHEHPHTSGIRKNNKTAKTPCLKVAQALKLKQCVHLSSHSSSPCEQSTPCKLIEFELQAVSLSCFAYKKEKQLASVWYEDEWYYSQMAALVNTVMQL